MTGEEHRTGGVAGQGGATQLDATPLPPLRAELSIREAAADAGWAGGHLVHDPLRNAYFRISHLATRALACWSAGTVGGVRACLKERFGIEATAQDIVELHAFLEQNALLQTPPDAWPQLHALASRLRPGALKWLLHHYLYFRIPLVHPQRFLKATFPYVRWLGSRAGLMVLAVVFLLGAWLTLQQFDEFRATFMEFVNLHGVALFALTIVAVKVAHELGHAYIATRYGVRVPHMGVAFLVMVPMLYTDVTDAWKLKNRRARLLIGAGGMLVELALAGIALLLWAILPEGPGRTAAFFVATTSLATTLLVNMSPFMRFDGYHILADALRMHNLQPRAFALALWWLRRVLFAIDEPPPEELPPRLRRGLVAYAFATWIYRFFLFVGIAVLVYYAFPKVLGIFLAAVEIWWFVLRPVVGVLKDWWKNREELMSHGTPRRLVVAGVLALVLLFAPLWRSVSLPAVLLPAAEQEVYAPEPARLARLHVAPGQQVRRGQVLAELQSEDLEHEWRTTRTRLQLVEHKLARMVASRADLQLLDVLRHERQQLRTALQGLERRRQRLVLRAAHDGVIRTMQRGLHAGQWVGPGTMLMRVVAPAALRVAALAPETVVGRLRTGAAGTFVADDPAAPALAVRLADIGAARRRGRDIVYLSSVHGGPVAARRDPQDGEIHTRVGMFPLHLVPVVREQSGDGRSGLLTSPANAAGTPAVTPPCTQACRGRVVIEAAAESIAGRLARRILAILLRESGF